ncbi:MAG TPA: xanthine dehydrogenase family protein molybdopterin-binding subunit [Methylomirabilota bacterium]|nr:xanthine dehydrogenase family protein molybdopterin-binding subunit [Methylomirabilota bacterium]
MSRLTSAGFGTRYIGAHVKRLEDPRLITGQGGYLDDVRLPGMLHAAFVRSPHAHADLLRVDVAAALGLPGVAAALTGRDLEGQVRPIAPVLEADGFAATSWPALAAARVRFGGEPVAVLAAADPYLAADAAERVAVEYEPLAAVADVDAALAAGAPLLHDGVPGNALFGRRHSQGEVDAALARAAVVVRERFSHARCSAVPLEPRGVVACWEGEQLTAWVGTQVPFIYRAALASAFGLPENRVRVIVPDTGGGFGQKMHVMPEDLAVVALARRAGRSVKWVETRRENLLAASQAREARMELEAAADASGALLALRATVLSDAGAYHIYPLTQALEPLGGCGILPGPYRVPAYAYELVAVATNKPPLGAYRGVGMPFAVFAMERTLDLLAGRLGLDPAEIRRRNLIPRDAYPFTSAAGFVYDSGDFPEALERALALADYERLTREREEARRRGRLLGIGIACYTEHTGVGSETYRRRGMVHVPGPEAATVKMDRDGGVRCFVSFPSQGQGHATTVAQLVAEQLGVPIERVAVRQPDTDSAPPGTGTFASRGAVVQGGTVERAAAAVRAKILALAGGLLEVSPADLELQDGRVVVRGVPDRGLALTEVARLAYSPPKGGLPAGMDPGLEATRFFDPVGTAFSGAVHVAAVEVDPDTGRVQVREYALVEDCGPVINPMIVEGQVHGALAQGIGEALGERLVYDGEGQLLTGTLMEYAVPTAAALPAFVIGHLETPSPHTPGGVKGMGEGGTVGAPAAIANAVADAVKPLGIPVTALPILSEALTRGH